MRLFRYAWELFDDELLRPIKALIFGEPERIKSFSVNIQFTPTADFEL